MPKRKGQNRNRGQTAPDPNLPKTPEQLEHLLLSVLNPATVQEATGTLVKFMKKKACVAPLVQQVQSSSRIEARHMGAVLLRARVPFLWTKLPSDVKQASQAILLDRLVSEESRPVRLAITALISQVAKQSVPRKEWPNLLDSLLQISQSQNAAHRQVGLMLFRSLSEHITKTLKAHFKTLLGIFTAGLQDPEPLVQEEAIKAIGVLVEMVSSEEDVLALKQLVPALIQYSTVSLERLDEDSCLIAFSVLDDLAESPVNILQDFLPMLMTLMLQCIRNEEMPIELRAKGSTFLRQIVQAKPGQLTKNKLLEPVLDGCIQLCIEPGDNVFETGALSPQNIVVELLDTIVLNIPLRLVYPKLIGSVGQLITSENEYQRKGAFVLLAVMTEGCAELMHTENQIPNLVASACNGVRDSSTLVRASSCVALIQFADHLQPAINNHHAELIPSFLSALQSPSEHTIVKQKCCVALEVFIETLAEQIEPYTQTLMNTLLPLLNLDDRILQCHVISTIKSVAISSRAGFTPWAEQVLNMMAQLMRATDPDFHKLRCAATECVGGIALGLGEPFHNNYLPAFYQLALSGMTEIDYFELRESTYNFFTKVATSLEQKFEPMLVTVMPLIVASLMSLDGVNASGREELGGANPDWVNAVSSDDEEDDQVEILADDSDDENAKINFSIRAGALDEKMAATNCLTTIIENVGPAFFGYFDKVFPALDELAEYPHPHLRSVTTTCLHEILKSVSNIYPHAPRPNVAEIDPNCTKVIEAIVPILIMRLVQEDQKEVCARACEALADSLNKFGIGLLGDKANYVYQGTVALMNQQAPCQQDEEDIDEKEIADHDEVLMDSVTDLIAALSKAVGPSFSDMYEPLHVALLKFTSPEHPQYDRAMSIGCFGEIVEHLGPNLPKFIDTIIPCMFTGLADPESVAVRRNSAFLAGNLVSVGGQALAQYYSQILDLLNPLFHIEGKESDDSFVGCLDNATSAVAKMIMVGNGPQFPLAQVFPVFLSALPIRSDFSEAKYCYACLNGLCNSNPELTNQYSNQIIAIISQILGMPNEWVSRELQHNLLQIVRGYAAQLGQEPFMQIVNALPQNQKQNLLSFFNSQ